jgi:hypothetical protein
VEIYFGLDALSRPRRARLAVDLSLAPPPGMADPEAARDEIRRRNLHTLTPQRAARFIAKHLPAAGRLSSEALHLAVEDDLLDLLAVLCFDRGATGPSPVTLRWRVHPLRADFGTDPARIPRDLKAGRLIERFTLERLP